MDARQNLQDVKAPAAANRPRRRRADYPDLDIAVRRVSRSLTGSADPHGGFQALEPRRLMSGTAAGAYFDGSTLSLEATAASANELRVELDANATHIRGVVNGEAGQWINATYVRKVEVTGDGSEDVVFLDARLSRGGTTLELNDAERVKIIPSFDNNTYFGSLKNDKIRRLYGRLLDVPLQSIDIAETTRGERPGDEGENQTLPYVGAVSVVDATTNKTVMYSDNTGSGLVIDRAAFTNKELNLIVHLENATGDFAGSVKFQLGDWSHVENLLPYAVFGGNHGDMNGWLPERGQHVLLATVYSGQNGQGDAGVTVKMSFEVIDSSMAQPPVKPSVPEESPVADVDPPVLPPVDGIGGYKSHASAPDARITAVLTTIAAGQSVHVSALATELHNGQWNDASVEWDFGDAGSEFNALRGFVGAHVYDRAGDYTVTLRVVDEAGHVGTQTMTVRVTASARKTIHVDANGSDANTGTSNMPVKTAARALELLDAHGDHAEILFRRGQDHAIHDTLLVKHDDVVVGSYGIGTKAKLVWRGSLQRKGVMIQNTSDQRQLTVRDLAFHAPGPSGTGKDGRPSAFSPQGDNVAFLNNTIHDMGDGVNANGRPTGVLVQGNDAMEEVGIREYFVWGEGRQLTILGNRAVNSTREHVIRLGNNGVEGVTISGNELHNISRADQGDPYDYEKGAITMQKGSFGYATDNVLYGPTAVGPLGDADGLATPDDRWEWAIFENNHFVTQGFQVDHGASHITARYNLVTANGGYSFKIEGFETAYNRGVVDVTIHGNVAVNDSAQGYFMLAYEGVNGLDVTDNRYVAPNLDIGPHNAGGMVIKGDSLSGFGTIDGNTWPVNEQGSWVGHDVNFLGWSLTQENYRSNDDWNALPCVGTDRFMSLDASSLVTAVLNQHGVPLLAA